MRNVIAILHKEWLELRYDRQILLGTLIPPLIFTVLPILFGYIIGHAPLGEINRAGLAPGATAPNTRLESLSVQEVAQVLISQQFSLLFFLMPMIIPSVIASYSIIGEKTRRTLEPVLATPVRTWELLLAKSLAALLPAVAITWLSGGIFVAGMAAVALSTRVFLAVVTPGWLLILLVCAPLISLIVIAAMIAISARVQDPRTAQQLSAFILVPFMAIFFGQLSGLLVLNPAFVLGASVALVACNVLALRLVTGLFQREVILTRWR